MSRRARSMCLCAAAITASLLSVDSASAQDPAQPPPPSTAQPPPPPPGGAYYTPPPPDYRTGWNFGFGLGGGDISCEGETCDGVTEAGSLTIQGGMMLQPRLRVLGDIWVMGHKEDNFTLTHSIVTGGLQYWLLNRLWLRGGIGVASAKLKYDGIFVDVEDRTENVLGISGGIGFEAYSKKSFALDVELRGGTGFYDDVKAHNAAFNVGVTWY